MWYLKATIMVRWDTKFAHHLMTNRLLVLEWRGLPSEHLFWGGGVRSSVFVVLLNCAALKARFPHVQAITAGTISVKFDVPLMSTSTSFFYEIHIFIVNMFDFVRLVLPYSSIAILVVWCNRSRTPRPRTCIVNRHVLSLRAPPNWRLPTL